jgi:N utilization substance protein B
LPKRKVAFKKGKPLDMSEIKRREARELVIALLFETEFKDGEDVSEIYEISVENREIPEDDYIKRAYFGVCENKEKIDELIGKSTHGWRTNRLTRLSRSVMRLAVYEMLFEEKIPNSVSINEAIELTKKFDDPKAKAFVNGVLNSVKNELEGSGEKND